MSFPCHSTPRRRDERIDDAFSAESPSLQERHGASNGADRDGQPDDDPEYTEKELYESRKHMVFGPLSERGIESSMLPRAVMSSLSACRRAMKCVRRRYPVR